MLKVLNEPLYLKLLPPESLKICCVLALYMSMNLGPIPHRFCNKHEKRK